MDEWMNEEIKNYLSCIIDEIQDILLCNAWRYRIGK